MKGKRAKTASAKKVEIPRIQFVDGERVLVLIDHERFAGRIKRVVDDKYTVRLDRTEGQEKGDLVTVSRSRLVHQMCKGQGRQCGNQATKKDEFCNVCRAKIEVLQAGREQKPFSADGIKWKSDRSFFTFETNNGVRFYGWYRMTRQRNSDAIAHCFDVYAKRTRADGSTHDTAVDSLVYTQGDPRENLHSINTDLMVLANRWYFQRLNGRAQMLDDLVKKAEKPMIVINTMETIDRIILRLQEYRSTALHSGGERYLELKGDDDGPPIGIRLNLSAQAFALKGKVPKVGRGTSADAARKSGRGLKGGDVRTRTVTHTATAGNVEDLMKALSAAKEAGDSVAQRSIRATLRQMGIKGGLRAYKPEK